MMKYSARVASSRDVETVVQRLESPGVSRCGDYGRVLHPLTWDVRLNPHSYILAIFYAISSIRMFIRQSDNYT